MLMANTNKAAHPPTAMPAIGPALRPLDSDNLEAGEFVGLLKELDAELLVDAELKLASLLCPVLKIGSETDCCS